MTEIYGIIHMVRNDGSPFIKENGETKQKKTRLILKIIGWFLPLIGRVQVKINDFVGPKTFAGLITDLKSNNGRMKFTIVDCYGDETSKEGTKPKIEEVLLEDLIEIDPINKVSINDLWVRYQEEKEKNHE